MKSYTPPSKAVANHTDSTIQGVSKHIKAIVDNRSTTIRQRYLQEAVNSQLEQGPQKQSINSLLRKNSKNSKGFPEDLKFAIELLSGYSLDDVQVHYNSDKPAKIGAAAFAQGTNIYLGPGQDLLLSHEAWHVVQQKQGRVKPTDQLSNNLNINGDKQLEQEATIMGDKAVRAMQSIQPIPKFSLKKGHLLTSMNNVLQGWFWGITLDEKGNRKPAEFYYKSVGMSNLHPGGHWEELRDDCGDQLEDEKGVGIWLWKTNNLSEVLKTGANAVEAIANATTTTKNVGHNAYMVLKDDVENVRDITTASRDVAIDMMESSPLIGPLKEQGESITKALKLLKENGSPTEEDIKKLRVKAEAFFIEIADIIDKHKKKAMALAATTVVATAGVAAAAYTYIHLTPEIRTVLNIGAFIYGLVMDCYLIKNIALSPLVNVILLATNIIFETIGAYLILVSGLSEHSIGSTVHLAALPGIGFMTYLADKINNRVKENNIKKLAKDKIEKSQ